MTQEVGKFVAKKNMKKVKPKIYKFAATGWLGADCVLDMKFKTISNAERCVDSFKFDDILVQASLQSKKDVEDMMKFLKVAKYTLPD